MSSCLGGDSLPASDESSRPFGVGSFVFAEDLCGRTWTRTPFPWSKQGSQGMSENSPQRHQDTKK